MQWLEIWICKWILISIRKKSEYVPDSIANTLVKCRYYSNPVMQLVSKIIWPWQPSDV